MIAFLFPYLSIAEAECLHDKMQRSIHDDVINIPKSKISVMSSGRHIINLKFDYSAIYSNSTDPYMCRTSGTAITWGGSTYTCSSSDILNETTRNVIIQTMENLKTFLQNTLKVTPVSGPWTTTASLSNYFSTTSVTTSADFYYNVFVRPFGTASTTASATFVKRESSEGRPIQGTVFLNVKQLPTVVQSETSTPNTFFQVSYHEINHALAFSSSLFQYWINPNTGTAYGSSLPMALYSTANYPNKTFNILYTPMLHKFAQKRFGVSTFFGSIPAGLEIEDGGGSGTAGSHPEGRVYFSDIMTGVSAGPLRISDLTFAALDDSGWYDVNYSNAVPLPWGYGESFQSSLLGTFPTSPAQSTFPSHYLCTSSFTVPRCTYDYSAVGVCSYTSVSCNSATLSSNEAEYCGKLAWADPLNQRMMGSLETQDFMVYVSQYSNRNCRDPSKFSTFFSGESTGSDSFCTIRSNPDYPACLTTKCNSDGTTSVTVGGITKICSSGGQVLDFGGQVGSIVCSPPAHICRIIQFSKKFSGNPYIESANTPTATAAQTNNQNSNGGISGGAVAGIVIGVLIAVGGAGAFAIYKFTNWFRGPENGYPNP